MGSALSLSPEQGSAHRVALMDELYRRYGSAPCGARGVERCLRFWRKKYAWILVVGGAKVLKRAIDLIAAAVLLIGLTPLFFVVVLLIKLTDRGPVLFWQTRVGRWGRELPLPKFRSMVVDAEPLKDALLGQSDHQGSITFKMKRDPRVTRIGRIIRKFSIDELPQLWCVFKGEMSLVGPRPPVPRKVAQYTLANRRRLDVVPGLTCSWQVGGRSDIPFRSRLSSMCNTSKASISGWTSNCSCRPFQLSSRTYSPQTLQYLSRTHLCLVDQEARQYSV
jgi:lipopolysaccharide/colanic/teichoic acid biosynthesis glycosyltransferase